ncbi:hypothetical protein KAR10_00655 [bacterium]|nr:hypothetical protein [bacterium]
MRTIFSWLSMVILSGALTTACFAHQDNSFTFTSTAGMFDDVYDLFKFSPAYLPGFERSTLWGQLSNLQNGNDFLFGDPTSSPVSNNYYLLGGQFNVMGLGRGGGMIDWFGESDPQWVTDYNGNNANGLAESTEVDSRDLDGDGIYDFRGETYGRIEKIDHDSNNDIYVVFGMGGLFGMDMGAGVRADWDSYQPSYNPYTTANPFTTGTHSFNEKAWERQYDLINNNAELYRWDQLGTGSLNYGTATWRLILSGRSKTLMPNLDLVVNAGPVLRIATNKYEYEFTQDQDSTPGNPATGNNKKFTESGIEAGTGVYPGSGIGFLANARADYTLYENLLLTARIGWNLIPYSISDAQLERNTWELNRALQRDEQTIGENYTYEGDVGSSLAEIKLRAQYTAQGWKLGMGINASTSSETREVTTKYEYSETDVGSNTGDPSTDYTETITEGRESITKSTDITDTLELPVGMVLNIVKKLPIRFGAKHIIRKISNTDTYEVTARTPRTTRREYGDGAVDHTVSDISEYFHWTDSSLTVTHETVFYYGLTWWPFEDLQIDIANCAYTAFLHEYNLSITFHF